LRHHRPCRRGTGRDPRLHPEGQLLPRGKRDACTGQHLATHHWLVVLPSLLGKSGGSDEGHTRREREGEAALIDSGGARVGEAGRQLDVSASLDSPRCLERDPRAGGLGVHGGEEQGEAHKGSGGDEALHAVCLWGKGGRVGSG